MWYKILIYTCSLAITLLSIEWKAWKTHKFKNVTLSIFFILALILGIKDIVFQDGETNKELATSKKNFKMVEDTLSRVMHILEDNKITFNFRSTTYKMEIGVEFYKKNPDPDLKYKLLAFENSQKAAEYDRKEAERKANLKAAEAKYDSAKSLVRKDSIRLLRIKPSDPRYKQVEGYLQEDRQYRKEDMDMVKKYQD